MKKVLAILLVTVLAFSMITVSASAETAKPRVAFICKGYSDTYCYLVMQIFLDYYEKTYKDLYTVDTFDGEFDSDKINTLIETCTADKYDVIIMQQNDPDTPVPYVKAAVAAGTQVIITVGSINDDGESYYLDADPVQQGSLLVEYAVKEGFVKAGTKCAVLRGLDGTFHSEGRTEGFVSLLTEVGADIVDNQTAEWSTSKAMPIVESWLISNPEIECIFACNDDMALGALQAMALAGRKDIKVFSVDANELGCIALKNGQLTATVAQDTFGYANGAADFAAQLVKGEKVESKRLDSKLILLDQVDDILRTVHGYTDEEIAKVVEQ